MFVYEYILENTRDTYIKTKVHAKEPTVEPWRTAIAGAVAGMTSWLPAIPFDVVKTRMMTETDPKRFRNMWHCFEVLIKVGHDSTLFWPLILITGIVQLQENGYRCLFRGGTVLVLRSAPISAVSFMGYEYMLRYCQSQNNFLWN